MAILPVADWDTFVNDNLLNEKIVNGVCLATHRGAIVYRHGDLTHLTQAELKQFLLLFQPMAKAHEQEAFHSGFVLRDTPTSVHPTTYTVHHHTTCSVYAACGGKAGLTVNNLPFGILLCTYRHPVHSSTAIKLVENFCDKLRA